MDGETRQLLDQLNRTFAEFRAANDEQIKELKTRGTVDPLLAQKVDKTNGAVTTLETALEQTRAKVRELETAQARLDVTGSERRDKAEAHARQFFALTRGQPAEEIAVSKADVEAYEAYKTAFPKMLRRNVGPLDQETKAALQVGVNPDGGYWCPPDTTGRIAEMVYETSPMRQLATVEPVGSDTYEGFYDLDEVDSGWTSEGGPRDETAAAQIGQWRIPVHEQWANPRATQKVLDDAQRDIEAWFAKKVSAKLARRENNGFVVGNGVGKPRGFTTYPAAKPTKADFGKIEVQKTGVGGGFAADPDGADVFIDTISLMKEPYLGAGCAWAMTRMTKAAVRKLKDANGHYLLIPDFRDGFRDILAGYPVYGFEDMAQIGAGSLSIAFANWPEAYTIADRPGIRVLRDPFTAKPYVQFYTTKRVGGDVVNFEAIKLIQFSA